MNISDKGSHSPPISLVLEHYRVKAAAFRKALKTKNKMNMKMQIKLVMDGHEDDAVIMMSFSL